MEVARIGVTGFPRQLVERDRAGLKRPREIVAHDVAVQIAQPFGDRHPNARRDRPRPIGLESDHARRQEVELTRQCGRDREVG